MSLKHDVWDWNAGGTGENMEKSRTSQMEADGIEEDRWRARTKVQQT